MAAGFKLASAIFIKNFQVSYLIVITAKQPGFNKAGCFELYAGSFQYKLKALR